MPRRDLDQTECPCGQVHPPAYRLTGCDHPGCTVVGCHICLARCGASDGCGSFCADHLEAIEGIREPACFRCVEEAANDELAFQGIIAAAFEVQWPQARRA